MNIRLLQDLDEAITIPQVHLCLASEFLRLFRVPVVRNNHCVGCRVIAAGSMDLLHSADPYTPLISGSAGKPILAALALPILPPHRSRWSTRKWWSHTRVDGKDLDSVPTAHRHEVPPPAR